MESPLRSPPPGFVSNFENPEYLGTPVVATAGVCIPIIVLFAAVRMIARYLTRKWSFVDYLFCISCLVGIAFIALSIPLTLIKPYGYHAWDIDATQLTQPSLARIQAFAILTGPVLWLTKVTLFAFLMHVYKHTRWFKNSAYVGIITTGLVFALYTCTVTIACAPQPDSDVESYIAGLRRDACSSSQGANLVVSLMTGLINSLTDLYLITAAVILNSSLHLTSKEKRGVYLIQFSGATACICGFLGFAYRTKTWHDADITGYQIPLNVALIIEVALSIMIPCMPSFYTIWRHYTYVEINERTTIGSPSTRFASSMSFYQNPTPTPPPEVKKSSRKTHMSIEDLPYRKPSSEFYRGSVLSPRDSRMKALPCTPLPFNAPRSPKMPKTPKTPNSVRSMHLPILLESPDESVTDLVARIRGSEGQESR